MLLFGRAGLVALRRRPSPGAQLGVRDVALPQEYDEVVAVRGQLVAANIEGQYADVDLLRFSDGELVVAASLRVGSIPESSAVDLIGAAADGAFLAWRDDDQVSLVCLTWGVDGSLRASDAIDIRCPVPGTVVYGNHTVVLIEDDQGPSGTVVSVVDLATGAVDTFNGGQWWVDDGNVLVQSESDSDRYLLVLTKDGQRSRLRLPGPISGFGGAPGAPMVNVFTGDDETVYVLVDNDDGFELQPLSLPRGKKVLGAGLTVVTVHGYDGELVISSTSVLPPARDVPRPRRLPLLVSEARGHAVGTVIHFHGGPESFEVPEPRMFGLPAYANQTGWDWVGVNYPGSLAPFREWTERPWTKWREETERTFHEALKGVRGPIVLAGWSFGAALALALANQSSRIAGLLLGGTPGSLRDHVARAVELDPRHGPWFARRFDVDGDDGDFLSGTNSFRRDLSVLEIHGADDTNCPIDLCDRVAENWRERGNEWNRVALPGREHYASTLDDALTINRSSRAFLDSVRLRRSRA